VRPLRFAVIVGAIASFAASGRLWFGALSPGTPELLPPSPEPHRIVLTPATPVVVHAASLPTRTAAPLRRHHTAKTQHPSSDARGVATAAGPLISPVVYHPQAPVHHTVAAPSATPPKPKPKSKPTPVTPTPSPSPPPAQQPSPPSQPTAAVSQPSTETPAPPSSSSAPASTPSTPAPTETPPGGGSSSPPPQASDSRPGWGLGDDNHVHTGPPGQPDQQSPPGQGNGDQGGHGH
jgi:hypothetical protein